METLQIEQRTDEWLEQRRGKITASAIGAIMGLAPYQTRDDVMRRMVREYFNYPSEFSGNAATEYGTFHEAGAIAEFEMETGLTVSPAPFVISKEIDYIGASPDGYVSDERLIEVKCPYGLKDGGEFKSIKAQMHYYAQIQMQLFCTDKKDCYFFQWQPTGTVCKIVKKDIEFIKKMLAECEIFYNEYLEIIKNGDVEKYLTDKTKKVHDSIELDEMMNKYIANKETIDKLQEENKALLSGMVALTDDKGGKIAGHTLYKTERQGSIAYAQVVKALLPGVDLEQYRSKPTALWSVR